MYLDKVKKARVLKMDDNFQYFQNLRQRLLESSQIIIRYRWKRYIKQKKRVE